MHVVVGGASEVGRRLARELRGEGYDVSLIENDPILKERAQRLDVLVVDGSPASPRAQEIAGIDDASIFYALTENDETNLMACAIAKTKGVRTVARITSLDYLDLPILGGYAAIGADVSVCLEFLSAIKLARIVERPRLVNVDVLSEGRLELVEEKVDASSPALGRDAEELPVPSGTRVLAVLRGRDSHLPREAGPLQQGDRVLIAARDGRLLEPVESLFGERATAHEEPHRIAIVGATNTGMHLARILTERGKEAILLDDDVKRVETATNAVPRALVLHASATDRQVIEQENLEGVDALVAVSDREEFNILACLIAKQLGIPRVVSAIEQPELRELVEKMGVDLAIAPYLDGIAAMLTPAHPLKPEELAILHGGHAQLLQVPLTPDHRIVGKPLRKSTLGEEAVVAGLVRDNRLTIPDGDSVPQPGDRLLLYVKAASVPFLRKVL